MNCEIVITDTFFKELKYLSKRYKSIKQDIATLADQLRDNPLMGVDLGYNLRKIRMAIKSKGKGKSAGARVIVHVLIFTEPSAIVRMLTIYDKSDRSDIADHELIELLKSNSLI